MSGLCRTPPECVQVRQLPLEPLAESVPAARSLLRELVEGTVFAARLEDGELALSEMVTNAVLHGREPIAVTVTRGRQLLRVEVTDASPVSPSFSMLDRTAVTGRGLLLISAVSDRWGVDPSVTGKAVWFELVAGRDARTELDVDALLRPGPTSWRRTRRRSASGSSSPTSTSRWSHGPRRTSRPCCASWPSWRRQAQPPLPSGGSRAPSSRLPRRSTPSARSCATRWR